MANQVFLEGLHKMADLSKYATNAHHNRFESEFRWAILTTIVVAYLICGFTAPAWAETYRGKVIDAVTGQPLEGAVFVIVWYKKGFVGMDGPQYFHSAKEALTDARGEFSVDGSPGIDWNPFTYLRNEPTVVVFMPGYGPYPFGHVKELSIDEIRKAMTGPGAVIKLPKLKTEQEMRRYVFHGALGILSDTPDEAIPNLIRLINVHKSMAKLFPKDEQRSRAR